MEKLMESLRKSILPESFHLQCSLVRFQDQDKFRRKVDHQGEFLLLAEKQMETRSPVTHVSVYRSGFLGAIALGLWFMEFDEDNWFSFESVRRLAASHLTGRIHTGDRIELRVLRGSFRDIPVLIDYRDSTLCFVSGRLDD